MFIRNEFLCALIRKAESHVLESDSFSYDSEGSIGIAIVLVEDAIIIIAQVIDKLASVAVHDGRQIGWIVKKVVDKLCTVGVSVCLN